MPASAERIRREPSKVKGRVTTPMVRAPISRAIGLTSADLDTHLRAHGYRIVSQSAQMSTTTAGRLLEHFGSLQAVFAASGSELAAVLGVGTARARAIRDGLARISDSVSSR